MYMYVLIIVHFIPLIMFLKCFSITYLYIFIYIYTYTCLPTYLLLYIEAGKVVTS